MIILWCTDFSLLGTVYGCFESGKEKRSRKTFGLVIYNRTNCEIKHVKSEQRKTSIVLLADSPAIPIRVIAPALLTAPALHQCPYLKPSLGDLAAQMELRFETPPFHFSWTRAAVVLPIASSKECIWCFVVGTNGTLSLQHRMGWNAPLGVPTFLHQRTERQDKFAEGSRCRRPWPM